MSVAVSKESLRLGQPCIEEPQEWNIACEKSIIMFLEPQLAEVDPYGC